MRKHSWGVLVFYRVKKVKGKYYLVKEWWDPLLGRKRSVSFGSCEKIEELVKQAKKGESGAGAGIRTRAGRRQRSLRWVNRELFEEIERIISQFNTISNKREFFLWLVSPKHVGGRGVTEKYARHLVNNLDKPFSLKIKYRVIAYRLFLKFLSLVYGIEVDRYLKVLKTPRGSVDLWVPDQDQVVESLVFLKNLEGVRHDYFTLYLLLLSSGIRLSEALFFLANLDRWERVEKEGVTYYVVNWQRGSKAVFYVFTPSWLSLRQEKINWETHGPHRKVPVKPKYVRKFVATKMFELNVSAEIIDFIQGRVPRSILAQHYLNLLPRAVRDYQTYAEWLTEFLEKNGLL